MSPPERRATPDETRETIECATHGRTPFTLACVHLVEGTGRGVRFVDDTTVPWPDALCDACFDDPDWNDEVAVERLRSLCSHCWETCIARNTRVPPHDDPDEWLHAARHRAAAKQDRWMSRFDIGGQPHFRFVLDGDDPPWLGFGADDEHLRLRCDALVIGSWSRLSNTWLWGWANDYWEPHLTHPFVPLKRFGEEHGLEPLWRSRFEADEDQGFALAAAALDFFPELDGMYRAPGERTSLFLAVMKPRYID